MIHACVVAARAGTGGGGGNNGPGPLMVTTPGTYNTPGIYSVLMSTPTGGVPPYSFAWTNPGGGMYFGNPSSQNTTAVENTPGTQTCVGTITVIDSAGTTATANETITFHGDRGGQPPGIQL